MEIKNKVTVNREGGGRGIIGEGPSRNMSKGPMDKAKGGRFESGRQGWVGQRVWWSENGDNCT